MSSSLTTSSTPGELCGPLSMSWRTSVAPPRIALAVLVDRGGRELPIHADIIGKRVLIEPGDRVDVMVDDLDGRTAVVIVPAAGEDEP
jgi:pyrimidine operon attenuation protein/uracil phosphoribosyltransferase